MLQHSWLHNKNIIQEAQTKEETVSFIQKSKFKPIISGSFVTNLPGSECMKECHVRDPALHFCTSQIPHSKNKKKEVQAGKSSILSLFSYLVAYLKIKKGGGINRLCRKLLYSHTVVKMKCEVFLKSQKFLQVVTLPLSSDHSLIATPPNLCQFVPPTKSHA